MDGRRLQSRAGEKIGAGKLRIQIGPVFELDQVAEAHRCMEKNRAGGKIVA